MRSSRLGVLRLNQVPPAEHDRRRRDFTELCPSRGRWAVVDNMRLRHLH
jgi:hypothetical protein